MNRQIASKWAPEFFQCPSQEYLCISAVSDMAPAGAVRSWPSCKQGLLSRGWGATERHGNRTNHPTKALLGRAQCWKSSEWGACLCWPRPLSAEAKSVPPTSELVQKGDSPVLPVILIGLGHKGTQHLSNGDCLLWPGRSLVWIIVLCTKGCGFNSWSGHIPKSNCVHTGGNLSMFLSQICDFSPPSPFLSL